MTATITDCLICGQTIIYTAAGGWAHTRTRKGRNKHHQAVPNQEAKR